MMKDGKALQAEPPLPRPKLPKAFDIQFLDRDNQLKYVSTTSGRIDPPDRRLIMVHGDVSFCRLTSAGSGDHDPRRSLKRT